MIFQYTLKYVLDGSKTQTRRLVKANETAEQDDTGQIISVLHNGRKKWRVGQSYGVQPSRNEKQVARIKMVALARETVSNISTADAIAEGYKTREEFLNTWENIHGTNRFDADVWVLTFELISVTQADDEQSSN